MRTAEGITLCPRSVFRGKEVGSFLCVTPPHQIPLWKNIHCIRPPLSLGTLPSRMREFHTHHVPPVTRLVFHGPYGEGRCCPIYQNGDGPFTSRSSSCCNAENSRSWLPWLSVGQDKLAKKPPPSWLRPDQSLEPRWS